MARTVLLVGTRKGLFLFESDEGRANWALRGPFCEGWPVYHAVHDAGTGAIYAAAASEWHGSSIWRSPDEGETWTTVELKVNYLRPAWPGQTVYAEGRVVNAGRTLALTECDVRDGDGKLLARASSTCMRLTSAESPAASAGS